MSESSLQMQSFNLLHTYENASMSPPPSIPISPERSKHTGESSLMGATNNVQFNMNICTENALLK